MKTELFIFFSNANPLRKLSPNTVSRLGGDRLFKRGSGNDLVVYYPEKQPILVNTDEIDYDKFLACPSLVIINDEMRIEGKPIDNLSELLHNFIEMADKVFIVFHESTIGINQPGILELCGSKLEGYLPQHHNEESFYAKYLIPLLEATQDSFNSIIQEFKTKFPNKKLEQSLRLLHDCLAIESAQEALKKDTSWLTGGEKTIVEYLAGHKDNLSNDYIEKLTELRIALLGS